MAPTTSCCHVIGWTRRCCNAARRQSFLNFKLMGRTNTANLIWILNSRTISSESISSKVKRLSNRIFVYFMESRSQMKVATVFRFLCFACVRIQSVPFLWWHSSAFRTVHARMKETARGLRSVVSIEKCLVVNAYTILCQDCLTQAALWCVGIGTLNRTCRCYSHAHIHTHIHSGRHRHSTVWYIAKSLRLEWAIDETSQWTLNMQ